jgi:hypothetical protein
MQVDKYEPGTPSWVDLGTGDPAAAAEFYSGLFGWSVIDQGAEAGGYRMAFLGDRPVAGIGAQPQPGMPSFWTTYVSVPDADATTKAVREAGGQVHLEPMDVLDVGRMAVFADESGAPFAAWQPRAHQGAGVVDEPGALSWNELATRDPDRAKLFYPAVFGWSPADHYMGETAYTEWMLGDRPVAGMMPMDERWPSDLPSHWMVYFGVEDTDAAVARAEQLGGAVVVPPTDIPPGRFAVLSDPQGAIFSIIATSQD